MSTMTAERLMKDLGKLPTQERMKFFALVGQRAFKDENFTHEEVFGGLANEDFTAKDAAEYLEVSIATFRRFVKDGKVKINAEVGKSQLFAAKDLQEFKQQRKAVKG